MNNASGCLKKDNFRNHENFHCIFSKNWQDTYNSCDFSKNSETDFVCLEERNNYNLHKSIEKCENSEISCNFNSNFTHMNYHSSSFYQLILNYISANYYYYLKACI